MKKTLKSSKGFTLVELMIVIFIMGLLLSVGVPSIKHIMITQRIRSCKAQMNILAADIGDFYSVTFPGESNIYFTDFLKNDRIAVSVSSTTLANSHQTAIKNNYETFKKHWICGSYDPETQTWVGEFNNSGNTNYYKVPVNNKDKDGNLPTDKDGNIIKDLKDECDCKTAGTYFLFFLYGHIELYDEDGKYAPHPVDCEFPKDSRGYQLYIEYTETGIDSYYNSYKNALENDASNSGVSRDSEIAANESKRSQTKAAGKQLPVGYITIKSTDPVCADIQKVIWIK